MHDQYPLKREEYRGYVEEIIRSLEKDKNKDYYSSDQIKKKRAFFNVQIIFSKIIWSSISGEDTNIDEVYREIKASLKIEEFVIVKTELEKLLEREIKEEIEENMEM